jgi:YVTN family beta-propeller protein
VNKKGVVRTYESAYMSPGQTQSKTGSAGIAQSKVKLAPPRWMVGRWGLPSLLAGICLFVGAVPARGQTVTATIPVGSYPGAVAMNQATNQIYEANAGSNTVSAIDGASNEVTATIPVGMNPEGVAVNPATNQIYVANANSNTVSVIDGSTNVVTATIPVGSIPIRVAVNPATNQIYVVNEVSDTVSVINGSTNVVTATIPVAGIPFGVAVNSVTNQIYVVISSRDAVEVINGSTNVVSGAAILVGSGPVGVAVNQATDQIYVANQGSDTVSVISGATDTVTATIPVGSSPFGLGVNTSTNQIYVANEDSNSVSVIDGATATVTAAVTVGSTPIGVAVNSATNRIYVANYSSNSVSVINGANAVPEINQPLLPEAAVPGTPGLTLIVNGTGFVTASVVNWNGQPRTTTFVSASELTASITAADLATGSTATVTVFSPVPGGGTSNPALFEITNPASPVVFARTDVGANQLPSAVAVGDFNGDGHLDMAESTDAPGGSVTILLSNGDGTFRESSPINTDADSVGIITADFNGDGKLDLAVVNAGSSDVSILLGNGDGTFQTAVNTSVGTNFDPNAIVAGDFNGDGILDLAVTNARGLAILIGNGDGTFQETFGNIHFASSPLSLAMADFNRDGTLDLAVTTSDNHVLIFLGNGDGTFQDPYETGGPQFATGNGPNTVIAADLSGDGFQDLAVVNSGDGTVGVLLGNGDGTFQPQVTYPVETGPNGIAVGDFDGDGKLDLAVANNSSSTVSLLLGNGDGTFQAATNYATGLNPGSPTAGDFNNDGRLDLAVPDFASSAISVLTQTPVATLSNNTLSFGSQPVGEASAAQTVSLSNTGSASLNVSAVSSAGPNAADFAVTNTCGTLPALFLPAMGCNISVIFTASTPTAESATITITDNANGSSQTIVLSGSGTTATTTPTVVSSENPSAPGQQVTFTVTVSPQFSGTPTGTVILKKAAATLATLTLSGGQASFTTSPLAVSTFQITAVYGGDPNFTGSTSPALTQVVKKGTTTTSVISSLDPSLEGQSVTFTATVSSSEGTPADGETITFTNGSTTLGTGTLTSGVATLATSSLPAGTLSIKAKYPGDTAFLTSTSAVLTQTVNKSATTTVVASSLNPSDEGQQVTFTATASAGSGTPPDGELVTFKNGAATLGTAPLAGGSATFTTSSLAVGSHSITAKYPGDTGFLTSTSPALTQVVGKFATTTTLLSDVNPSSFGQNVTFTAAVTSASGGTPTGTVTFKNGSASLGTVTLAGGTANVSTSTLTVATHSIIAVYNGDANDATSTSPITSQVVTKAATNTSLISSLNPSSAGQPVTFTATVTSSTSGTPTGTVIFKSGSKTLGSKPLSGGTASVTVSTLAVGTDTITATYNGSTDFVASPSNSVAQVVNQ